MFEFMIFLSSFSRFVGYVLVSLKVSTSLRNQKTQNRSFIYCTLFEGIPFWKNNHLGKFGIFCFCWNRFLLRFQVRQQISTSSARQMDGSWGTTPACSFWGVQTAPRLECHMKFPIFLLHAFFFLGEKIWNPPCFKPQSWDEFGGFHEFHIPENKQISPEKCCDWKTIFPFKMFPFRGDIHSCSGKVFNESPFLSLENDIYCRDMYHAKMTSVVETKWQFHLTQMKESLAFCYFGSQ